ncbi:hypothetical protein CAPTEDRAFT_217263 [Capitella teleta]|uniref:Coiled-coil domain-containing protein 72 homolog n=1 Tax=Capitella teleta TaxID=283909 RepID=R7T7P3_CAPTE|nr:hypothetical protein CAPTEDRAFT_217263 [Capitella teleta]|eukprot:ELT89669.1 hypothetical protein CAPTEDRAFT_217263 [Capitella teleta]
MVIEAMVRSNLAMQIFNVVLVDFAETDVGQSMLSEEIDSQLLKSIDREQPAIQRWDMGLCSISTQKSQGLQILGTDSFLGYLLSTKTKRRQQRKALCNLVQVSDAGSHLLVQGPLLMDLHQSVPKIVRNVVVYSLMTESERKRGFILKHLIHSRDVVVAIFCADNSCLIAGSTAIHHCSQAGNRIDYVMSECLLDKAKTSVRCELGVSSNQKIMDTEQPSLPRHQERNRSRLQGVTWQVNLLRVIKTIVHRHAAAASSALLNPVDALSFAGGKKKPLKAAKKDEKNLDEHDLELKKKMREEQKALKEAREKVAGGKKKK